MDWIQIKNSITREQIIELLEDFDGYGIVFEDEDLVRKRLTELGYRKHGKSSAVEGKK